MSLNVKVTIPPKPAIIHIKDMQIGQVGYVRGDFSYDGVLLLRTYNGAVDLMNPRCTFGWGGYKLENESPPNFQIELLPPGSVITITLK